MTESEALKKQRDQAREVAYILLRYLPVMQFAQEDCDKVRALIASIEGGPGLSANLNRKFEE